MSKQLRKRARELQRHEWEQQQREGNQNSESVAVIDHVAADRAVMAALKDDENFPTWAALAVSDVVGRARGEERRAQGPRTRKLPGQMQFIRSPDVLLMLSDDESAYLGDIVDARDAARLNAAIAFLRPKREAARQEASRLDAESDGLLVILGELLRGEEVLWDADSGAA